MIINILSIHICTAMMTLYPMGFVEINIIVCCSCVAKQTIINRTLMEDSVAFRYSSSIKMTGATSCDRFCSMADNSSAMRYTIISLYIDVQNNSHICLISALVLKDPSWTTYKPQGVLTKSKKILVVNTSLEDQWKITADNLEKVCTFLIFFSLLLPKT